MKTRVISGLVLAVILIGVWTQIFNPIFDVFFALLAALACYEVLKVTGVSNMELKVLSIAFAFVLPLGVVYASGFPLWMLCAIYVIALVILTIIHNDEIRFEHLAISIYASFIIPIAFSTISLIADLYKVYDFIDKRECVFFIWFAVSCALFTDVFAYFVGVKFGKHKMTPVLSPKKSWEGAIGGVVLVVLWNLLSLFVFTRFLTDKPFAFPVWAYIIASVLLAICGIFGDLAASLIKRNYNVKDYSNLIPGHGGIMDRFDSVIMVMPAFYVLMTIYGLVVC